MSNLCKTNKQLANICTDNEYLRRILYNTDSTIYIPPNFDIGLAMKQLNTEVEKLFFQNYPPDQKYPKWIDKEAFINHMKRVIYCDLHYLILETLSPEDISDITIEIYKDLIGIPFAPQEVNNLYSHYDISEVIDYHVKNKIVLSKHFIDYIKYPILKFATDHDEAVRALAHLLFLRDYTFDDCKVYSPIR